jgi:hypothetical protein
MHLRPIHYEGSLSWLTFSQDSNPGVPHGFKICLILRDPLMVVPQNYYRARQRARYAYPLPKDRIRRYLVGYNVF